ncbi:hypothetical protein B0J14DRAFT_373312 [Halenospora varia]|nr:hypothetical protein B0J14DRAFT_373312 [Halenospora varia]
MVGIYTRGRKGGSRCGLRCCPCLTVAPGLARIWGRNAVLNSPSDHRRRSQHNHHRVSQSSSDTGTMLPHTARRALSSYWVECRGLSACLVSCLGCLDVGGLPQEFPKRIFGSISYSPHLSHRPLDSQTALRFCFSAAQLGIFFDGAVNHIQNKQ